MSKQDQHTADTWQMLLGKFKSHPYFGFAPAVQEESSGIVLRPAKVKMILLAGWMIVHSIIVAGLLAAFSPSLRFYGPWARMRVYLLLLCAVALPLIGFYYLLRQRKIVFDRGAGVMSLFYGVFPFTKCVSLPYGELGVQMTELKPGDPGANLIGQIIEVYLGNPCLGTVKLLSGRKGHSITPTYEIMEEVLKGQVDDGSMVQVKGKNGETFKVSAWPMVCSPMEEIRRAKLSFPDEDQAMVSCGGGDESVFPDALLRRNCSAGYFPDGTTVGKLGVDGIGWSRGCRRPNGHSRQTGCGSDHIRSAGESVDKRRWQQHLLERGGNQTG